MRLHGDAKPKNEDPARSLTTAGIGDTDPPLTVLTIGHSTLSLDEFLVLLDRFHVRTIADVRSFPASQRFPHFNRQDLAASLAQHDVRYVWLAALGGRRHSPSSFPSPNTGLASPGFRSYADYMLTDDFHRGIDQFLILARQSLTAILCAEAVYWRCHRRLISDYLTAHGVSVRHILGPGVPRPHRLTPAAVTTPEKNILYPGLLNLTDEDSS